MTQDERCYALFGLSPGATTEEVKRAYRALVRKWHPDQMTHDARKHRVAEERMKELNLAYARLEYLAEHPAAAPPSMKQATVRRSTNEAPPGYDPYGWRQGMAQQTNGQETPAPEETTYDRAVRLYYAGLDAFRAGEWREAVSALMQSVCLVQNNADAYYTLGQCYQRLRFPAKAAAAFQQAIRLHPWASEPIYQYGITSLALGDRATAQAQEELLRDLDPELADALRSALAR